MMMRINKQKALSARIDQLNDQVSELVTELNFKDIQLAEKDRKIASLKAQLEERTMLADSMRDGQVMTANIIDSYLKMIRDEMPQEIITMCQEAIFDLDDQSAELVKVVELDDVISAVYAARKKYFKNC
jgi:aspartate/glutamate racemase